MAAVDTTLDSSNASGNRSSDASGGGHSLNSQIRLLLLGCSSREDLVAKVLEICTAQFGSSVERFDLQIGAAMQTKTAHHQKVPQEVAARFDSELLGPMADEMLAGVDSQPRLKRFQIGDQELTLISVPIMDIAGDCIEGAITLLIGGQPRPELVLPRLDSVAAVVATVLSVISDAVPRSASAANRDGSAKLQEAPRLNADALGKVAQFTSTKEFAYSVVNSLCEQLKAEQVFFGVEKNLRVRVKAVSGIADFKNSNPGIAIVQQAMEECLDVKQPIVFQTTNPTTTDSMPIHRNWSADSNHSCVCSIPLKQGEDVTGVVSIRRPSNRPFSFDDVAKLELALTPYGAAIRLLEKANSPVSSLVTSAMSDSVKSTVARGTLGRKLVLGAIAVGMCWFAFGTMTYRPLCRTTVMASNLRHVAAPLDGKLLAVNVSPGQSVRKGDLLLEFDSTDLQLQLNGVVRDISAAQIKVREAISSDDISMAAVARSHMNVLKTQAAALQKQIQDSRIVAPDNGTVVLSDLQQRVGQVFPQGEEILQFASEGDWLLEIEVPDDIVHYVLPQQTGSFAAASLPGELQSFSIETIDGGAQVIGDRNVFMARAVLDSHPDWMKSGMEGTVRVESVSRPVWWVALHRVVDWARSSYWI